jgi:hypothetical protein
VSSSEVLKTMDNPLGLGVYNTRDEPNGLNQGIQRVLRSGKGIPTFADSPVYQRQDKLGRVYDISPEKSIQIENEFAGLKEQVKKGAFFQSQLNDEAKKLSDKYKLTSDAQQGFQDRLNRAFNVKQRTPGIRPPAQEAEEVSAATPLSP